MSCNHSRPDRFTRFGQMEKYSQSLWDVCHAFIQGWAIHACCKLHVPLHVSECHLSPCVSHSMSLVPQHGTQLGTPNPLNTRTETKPAGCQQMLCNRASYYTVEPTQGYGRTSWDPVLRLWEHYLSGPFSRLWESASLSCPDTWVRKPDCLCLHYTWILRKFIFPFTVSE